MNGIFGPYHSWKIVPKKLPKVCHYSEKSEIIQTIKNDLRLLRHENKYQPYYILDLIKLVNGKIVNEKLLETSIYTIAALVRTTNAGVTQ